MDAIDTINIDSDTTFILGLEAQKRGYALYYYQPHQLSLHNGTVTASVQPLHLRRDKDNYFTLGEVQSIALNTMDVVLMRQDPPYDMNYLTYTYFLERIHPDTMVVNNPTEVRNCPEKIFVCDFAEFMAPTLISANKDEITAFKDQHRDIILKPLYAHGGADIYRAAAQEDALAAFDILHEKYRQPIIAQTYLPNVVNGDKRIIFIDGKVAGAINRIPAEGGILSNLVRGGTAHKTTLTARELAICEVVGPELKKRGLLLVGIDVIDGYLTEINVTSPTGLQSINRLENTCLEAVFWDAVEMQVTGN